jgi:protein-arginine kinase activator protein McsA
MSRKNSHAKGIGAHVDMSHSHMQHSHSHKSLLHKELVEAPHDHNNCQFEYDEDLINPDEFEEIAEIYDSIRLLH